MRLIDSDALKETLRKRQWYIDDIEEVEKIIDNASTIEPTYISDMPDDEVKDLQELAIDYGEGIAVFERKRPQSEWIRIDEEKVKCPICEVIHLMYSYPRTTANFCPACGAKLCMGEQK